MFGLEHPSNDCVTVSNIVTHELNSVKFLKTQIALILRLKC